MKCFKLSKKFISNVLLLTTVLTVASVGNPALAATKEDKMPKIKDCKVIEKHNEILDAKELFKLAKQGTDHNIKIKDYDAKGNIKSVSQVVAKYEDLSSGDEITETNVTTIASIKTPDDATSANGAETTKNARFDYKNGINTMEWTGKDVFGTTSTSDSLWDSSYSVKLALTSKFYFYTASSDGRTYYRIESATATVTNSDSSVSIKSGKITLGQTGVNASGVYKSQTKPIDFYSTLSNKVYYPDSSWNDVANYNQYTFKVGASMIVYLQRGTSTWNSGYLTCNL
ncbi:hypothetical protein [Clostridium beijerinckii]|uniref:hypothetical protein n=1 Tax=Clostridium beijerinckii TaxID=1520 RepID=UPI001361BC54|nr:hypothetical protein [Clostridium beijerinckii]MZK53601.1 hypothetical protein [Clostridium beijerinckii]MZK61706.1 hypothetical protein [Clostridium beijerinckii]MZK71480.1 hypothetical protein [Clostridium beijerinckii]MZK76839.1 hypothetical protein [Clostridium beijerinckii]MZK85535.1 hypothetical protein [Clostridium beijerinckii]